MNEYVIAPPPQASVPVRGGGLFPVRRIFCVGRNYADHAREMGGDPEREAPFFFAKPADAVLTGGADMPYPAATEELHHEMELVAAIGAGGSDIAAADALAHVWGYAAGLDMTRRDLQAAAKQAGRPWDMAKGFDLSAPIGALVPVAQCGHPRAGRIELRVNGAVRQEGDLGGMIWDVAETVAALSALVRLMPGDLVFTGTPAGVGAVGRGGSGAVRQEGDLGGMIWDVAETVAALSALVRLMPGDLVFTGTPAGVGAVGRGDSLVGTIEGVGEVRTTIR